MSETNIEKTRPITGKEGYRDSAISMIRLFALLCIVSCHILQYLNIELAFWINIGVQVFLCISGYLYGKKEIGDTTEFYKKRFIKILVPYFIVLFFFVALQFFIKGGAVFSIKRTVAALFLRSTIPGGEHLWFVSTILLCYVITPLLEKCRQKIADKKQRYYIYLIVSLITVFLFFKFFATFYNPAWISCYVIGYFLGVSVYSNHAKPKALVSLLLIMAIAGNALQIYIDYVISYKFQGVFAAAYKLFSNYNHVWLGISLFIVLKYLFGTIKFTGFIARILDLSDKYSYEYYLIHQFFILGPFSLMAMTKSIALNILIIIVAVSLLAFLLNRFSAFLINFVKRKNQY